MKLDELQKRPEDMSDEELYERMLSSLDRMDKLMDVIDIKFGKAEMAHASRKIFT